MTKHLLDTHGLDTLLKQYKIYVDNLAISSVSIESELPDEDNSEETEESEE